MQASTDWISTPLRSRLSNTYTALQVDREDTLPLEHVYCTDVKPVLSCSAYAVENANNLRQDIVQGVQPVSLL